jgi:hypothetical protein
MILQAAPRRQTGQIAFRLSPALRSVSVVSLRGKHALTSASATPETFDESRDRRTWRKTRTRQRLGAEKADMPALKAFDRYTVLGTHDADHFFGTAVLIAVLTSQILSPFDVTTSGPDTPPSVRLSPVSRPGLLLFMTRLRFPPAGIIIAKPSREDFRHAHPC